MNNSKYYPLALEALMELAPEIAASRSRFRSNRPSLGHVLNGLGALPAGALFLGMADDGLPVLLNLYDATPGPLLIAGDETSGKTTLLKTLSLASSRIYEAEEIQFSVTTSTPEEWGELEHLPHCAGITHIEEEEAQELVTSLYDWAHQNNQSEQVVLFLIDGLDKTGKWSEIAKSSLRWLLARGPARRIWPILTINSSLIPDAKGWISLFRTFIYGKISNESLADALTGASNARLSSLREGEEFSMREGKQWLRFWLPDIR